MNAALIEHQLEDIQFENEICQTHNEIEKQSWVSEELNHAITTLETISQESLNDPDRRWLAQDVVGVQTYSQEGIVDAIGKVLKKIWEGIQAAFSMIGNFFAKILEFFTGSNKQLEKRKQERDRAIKNIKADNDRFLKGLAQQEKKVKEQLDQSGMKESLDELETTIMELGDDTASWKASIPANLNYAGSQSFSDIFDKGIKSTKELIAKQAEFEKSAFEIREQFIKEIERVKSVEELNHTVKRHIDLLAKLEQQIQSEFDGKVVLPNVTIGFKMRKANETEQSFGYDGQRLSAMTVKGHNTQKTQANVSLKLSTVSENLHELSSELAETTRSRHKEQDKARKSFKGIKDHEKLITDLLGEELAGELNQSQITYIVRFAYDPNLQPFKTLFEIDRKISVKALRLLKTADDEIQDKILTIESLVGEDAAKMDPVYLAQKTKKILEGKDKQD